MTSSYRHIGNIKGGIFLIGVALVVGMFSYTRYLSAELREDNRDSNQLKTTHYIIYHSIYTCF